MCNYGGGRLVELHQTNISAAISECNNKTTSIIFGHIKDWKLLVSAHFSIVFWRSGLSGHNTATKTPC